ncbi:peroxisomal membrane protein PEX14 isoform X2 [Silene latifolia]|uniref:peroxisomal membrane protein PEX14 isoform X2 n=1 Tax=Silene latifolia TaxID=37657 RepID=UPI003D78136D
MATQSPPPNPTNSEPSQTALNDSQAATEPPQENSQASVFVNSEPIREEQVQNAIKFLSHPRVRGSPVLHRRNFLEKKGLTKEEIDEAFRRVPDPSPATTSGQTSTHQDAQAGLATNAAVQAPVQLMQPVAAAPPGVMSTMTRRFHWSHAVLAIGLLAMSGAGTVVVLKNSVIPRLKSWIRRVVLDEEESVEGKSVRKPTLAEEATAAAKAAAAAAADVAKASQEMLLTKQEEKKCFAEFMSLLDVQIHEMRTVRNAISKLEGQSSSIGRNLSREEYLDGSVTRSMAANGKYEFDTRSVRSTSPPVSAEPPHPKSYAEIMAMVQRGEKPPNVRDIDDRPPNPNQPISNPSLAPRSKPWETNQPTAEGSSYSAQDNGVAYQYSNDSSSSWWQQKNVRITEVENGDGHKFVAGSNDSVVVDRPPVRRWVPPQPPPVSMPEAAIAIRQPKSSSIPKDNTLRAEETAQPVSGLEELQRVTKISESGGQLEMNGGIVNSEINYSEIQEEATEV